MRKVLLLLLLVAFAFAYAMFQGGFVSWFLFYSFLPFAVYGFCLSLYSLSTFKVQRVFVKKEYKAGEKANIVVKMKRQRRFPLFYLLVEEENSQLSRAKKVFFPLFKKEWQLQYSIERLPRGEFSFQGIHLKTGDLLGLIEKEQFVPLEDTMLVYPAYEELSDLRIGARMEQGALTANERNQRDTSVGAGIRQYQPGDRLSWINWKASAKRNELMTREFEQSKSQDAMLVMDCSLNHDFERVVSVTASLIRAGLKSGVQVGLMTSSEERVLVPSRGGESQQRRLFYHLAKIRAASTLPFAKVLQQELLTSRQTATLMLVTANLTKELIDVVNLYSKRNVPAVLYLVGAPQDELVALARARGIVLLIFPDGKLPGVGEG